MEEVMEDIFNRKEDGENKLRLRQLEQEGIVYLDFPILEKLDCVKHGFSTRLGGVSEGIYAQMNLSFHRGDDRECVEENYRRICKALEVDVGNVVCSDQTHTTNIRVVTKEDRGKGFSKELDYRDIDGLVTKDPDVLLVTFYADCVPVFLVDPVQRAVGLCHSGWRGTVGKIGEKTVQKMVREFQSKPEDIVAGIGPSICMECYEVSKDVVTEFAKSFGSKHMEEIVAPKGNQKYMLDLWKANETVLREAGVSSEHIQVTDICTCCNEKVLFSHRASQGKRGNLAAFLQLKKL